MTSVILLGASTRAATTSARRAGWSPWCADLFADVDLQRIATVRKIPLDAYPHGLLSVLAEAPPGPVIYTGALENRPELIARLGRPVWGNTPGTLQAIRSPKHWTDCLHRHGLPCPIIREQPTRTGRWLLKPRKSAAGFGIHPYAGEPFDPRNHFLQEWIDGVPASAIFLGGADGKAILLGVTQQLVGTSWLHTTGFHYAGNIGPLPLNTNSASAWAALGSALAGTFALRGLFGIDAIVRDDVPWPVEINPRYTASVELLERAGRVALLPLHRDVFAPDPDTRYPVPRTQDALQTVHGKAILYARETLSFPAEGPWHSALCDGVDLDQVEFADIPHAGEIIPQGRPVLTLFASAPSAGECTAKLQEKAQALDRCLWG